MRVPNKLKVIRKIVCIFAVTVLAGCARQPSLESIAYREFGARSIVMIPQAGPPGTASPEYRGNWYQYVPGTVAAPKIVNQERDDLRRRAETWTVVQSKYCPQHQFRLNQTIAQSAPDIIDDYKLDASFSLNPVEWFSRTHARATFSDLSEEEFGRLKRVTIGLKNVRTFTLSENDLNASLEKVKRSKCYSQYLESESRKVQVAKVVMADVSIKTEAARGFRLSVGRLKGYVVKRSNFSRTGKSLLIAFVPR